MKGTTENNFLISGKNYQYMPKPLSKFTGKKRFRRDIKYNFSDRKFGNRVTLHKDVLQ